MNNQRRRLMQLAALSGGTCALGQLSTSVYAQTLSAAAFADYKALVCVFLLGGNDSWNMVVPTSTTEYNDYYTARGGGTASSLAIDQAALLPITPATALLGGLTLGLHPSMTGMQTLFQNGSCAVVANIGPLLEPTTLTQLQQRTVALPPQLFSHNDQQDQWHSLRGNALLRTGWAARIAETLATQVTGQALPLNLSLSGLSLFQSGQTATPYVMGATGANAFAGFSGSTLNTARRAAFEAILNATQPDVYQRGFANVQKRALQYADLVNNTLTAARNFTALPNTGVTLSSLATQLRTVAKIIDQRSALSASRQIFYVTIGGFDTHDNQLVQQPLLLGDVSNSIKLFYDALGEIGIQNSVTTFTHSDFGRTLSSNGDGSDHGWGGVQLVVGGAVRGQRVYGQYPSLKLGNPLDVGGGRIIPTTSADQYAATLARWFGVGDTDLPKIAPSVDKFTTRDLGFMT